MQLKKSVSNHLYPILLICIVLFTCLPIFFDGIYPGDDLQVHLARIEGIVYDLKGGVFPSYIPRLWVHGYGYPINVFYCGWFLYIPALLRLCGMPVLCAYKVYLMLAQALLVGLSYYSFKRIFDCRTTALMITFLYATAAYRFTDVYFRAALGEYTAMAFFPLVVWGIYEIYDAHHTHKVQTINDLSQEHTHTKTVHQHLFSLSPLALGMTGILLSHILSFFMTVILLILFCIIMWRITCKKETLFALMLAAGKTILLSAGFLIPFCHYMFGLRTFLQTYPATQMRSDGVDYVRDVAYGPGPALTILFLAALVYAIKLVRIKSTKQTVSFNKVSIRFFVITLTFAVLTLLLAEKHFPWDKLALRVPLMHYFTIVQFPWRWVAFAALFLSILAGILLTVVTQKASKRLLSYVRLVAIMGCLISALTYGLFSYRAASYPEKVYFSSVNDVNMDMVSNAEYMLAETNIHTLDQSYITDGIDAFTVKADTPQEIVLSVSATDTTHQNEDPPFIELPIFAYPGYAATTQDGQPLTICTGTNNRIRLSLPNGYSSEVHVFFKPPFAWTIGNIISLLAFLLIVISAKIGKGTLGFKEHTHTIK